MTYREACEQLGLLENDAHWDLTLHDASIASSPHQIRILYAIIMSKCFPSNPLALRNKYKDFMAEDYLIRKRHHTRNTDLLISLEMYNEGKTFVISLILAAIRSQRKIALALASLGIAATLLDDGRTVHSALKLPLYVQQVIEHPTCNISRNSAMRKVLQQAAIILLDECTMMHKKSLEALHRKIYVRIKKFLVVH
ncbi:uncharacterized protein [Eurosta solidaginis]|uniref:uncharacterized protein n=1 Tax=Eurosta solidaginis TaxID=178769 RepID=UPI003531590A